MTIPVSKILEQRFVGPTYTTDIVVRADLTTDVSITRGGSTIILAPTEVVALIYALEHAQNHMAGRS